MTAVVSSRLAVLLVEVGLDRFPRHDVVGIFGVSFEAAIQFGLLGGGELRIVTAFDEAFPKHLSQLRSLVHR